MKLKIFIIIFGLFILTGCEINEDLKIEYEELEWKISVLESEIEELKDEIACYKHFLIDIKEHYEAKDFEDLGFKIKRSLDGYCMYP